MAPNARRRQQRGGGGGGGGVTAYTVIPSVQTSELAHSASISLYLFENLLFLRQQIPSTIAQLRGEHADLIAGDVLARTSRQKKLRKFFVAIDTLEQSLSALDAMCRSGTIALHECVLILGSSVVTPREVHQIIFDGAVIGGGGGDDSGDGDGGGGGGSNGSDGGGRGGGGQVRMSDAAPSMKRIRVGGGDGDGNNGNNRDSSVASEGSVDATPAAVAVAAAAAATAFTDVTASSPLMRRIMMELVVNGVYSSEARMSRAFVLVRTTRHGDIAACGFTHRERFVLKTARTKLHTKVVLSSLPESTTSEATTDSTYNNGSGSGGGDGGGGGSWFQLNTRIEALKAG